MAKTEDRFVKTYTQSKFAESIEIWVDMKTGVNYMYRASGYSGGLCPLLDRDGKPVITTVPRAED